MSRTQIVLWCTIALIGISFFFLWPSYRWYRMMSPEQRTEAENNKDSIVQKTLNLGLDLRGGTHLLLELDPTKLDPKVKVHDALDRAIEIIRNRVDQFGVSEPLIARQGERWIVVQLPGVKDPEQAKDLIGKTALLEFRLVGDNTVLSDVQKELLTRKLDMAQFLEMQKAGTAPKEVLKLIPSGYEILPMRTDEENRYQRYEVVKSSPELTGATLVEAQVQFGQGQLGGYPSVSLEFNPEGAALFGRVTEANIKKNLAIVLDGIIQSSPEIQSAIPDGHAVINGRSRRSKRASWPPS